MNKNTIKTTGDWELDVLGIPYFGPEGGRDSEGEYFSPSTNLHLEQFGNPMVLYYHGAEPDGKPQGEPEIIGKTVSYEERSDGVWWRVALDKTSAYAKRVMDAARQGIARASSGSIAHLTRKVGGHILNWPVVEISIFDVGDNRQPANSYAVALPAAKSIYAQAGRDFPAIDEGDALQEQAKEILMRMKVDGVLEDKAFTRPATDEEMLFERAALGVLRHFQSNVKVESMPVRIVDESFMPSSALGKKLGGQYTDRGILISDFLSKQAEYDIFLHELGHCLDEQIGGEKAMTAPVDVREKQADFYKDLIGFYAIDQARRQFYGGQLVKSIPINKLLQALAE